MASPEDSIPREVVLAVLNELRSLRELHLAYYRQDRQGFLDREFVDAAGLKKLTEDRVAADCYEEARRRLAKACGLDGELAD